MRVPNENPRHLNERCRETPAKILARRKRRVPLLCIRHQISGSRDIASPRCNKVQANEETQSIREYSYACQNPHPTSSSQNRRVRRRKAAQPLRIANNKKHSPNAQGGARRDEIARKWPQDRYRRQQPTLRESLRISRELSFFLVQRTACAARTTVWCRVARRDF